jgi:hypothetical protein
VLSGGAGGGVGGGDPALKELVITQPGPGGSRYNWLEGGYTIELDPNDGLAVADFPSQMPPHYDGYVQRFATAASPRTVTVTGPKRFHFLPESKRNAELFAHWPGKAVFFGVLSLVHLQLDNGLLLQPGTILLMPGVNYTRPPFATSGNLPVQVLGKEVIEFFKEENGGHADVCKRYGGDALRRVMVGFSINTGASRPGAFACGAHVFKSGMCNTAHWGVGWHGGKEAGNWDVQLNEFVSTAAAVRAHLKTQRRACLKKQMKFPFGLESLKHERGKGLRSGQQMPTD